MSKRPFQESDILQGSKSDHANTPFEIGQKLAKSKPDQGRSTMDDIRKRPAKSPRNSPAKSPKKLRVGAELELDWLRNEPNFGDLVFQQFEVIDQADVIKIFGITEQGNSVLVNCT